MTIKAPAWVASQGGVPTAKGWKHPKRNEILLAKKFTQEQIDDYNGTSAAALVAPAVKDEWQAEDVNQDGIVDDLESMTKIELEELGREQGVELDRRKNRSTLINQMRGLLKK